MKKIIPILIVILAVLGIGGTMYYINYYQPNKADVADAGDVETKEIWNVANESGYDGRYWNESSRNQYFIYADAMNSSEGNLFFCEQSREFEGTPKLFELTSITQTDKESFENDICKSRDLSGKVSAGMLYFFNNDYKRVEEAYVISEDSDDMGDDICGQNWGAAEIGKEDDTQAFGANIKEYFAEHKLELSCNKIDVKKICAKKVEYFEAEENANKSCVCFFAVGTADVTTVEAEGDMNDLGIFGNKGETVKIEYIAQVSMREFEGIQSFALRQISK